MINTQTQIDSLIDLAVLQRTELKQLVESLPQLRDHLSAEIERNLEEIEPAIRSELEQFVAARALDTQAKTSAELGAKLDAMARNLESTTAAKYSVLMAERAQNATLLAQAEARIAEAASALPGAVKGIVTDELSRFPRAGEIDQLRKEFAEPRGLNPRGRWQVGETYNKLDLVSYNGDSYVSSTDGNREKPSRSSDAWTLSAARGNGGGGGGATSLTDLVPVPANGELLIGNGSAFVNNTLTAGTGVTITNGPGTITIDASGAQELLTASVVNAESVPITRGQVVYLFSATGFRPSVKLANNSADATSAKTFGVVSDDSIAANGIGTVTCVGVVDKLALGAYNDGDSVYLGDTPGTITTTKPYAPNHLVYVGIIERANNGNGELYVRIQNGYELDEIHDVQITSAPLAGALLMRDATNSLWKANRLTGTANQVTVTNADTAVTLSLPTTIANVNSVTAQTATNLTLTGGSTGASLVLGQGTTAGDLTLTPTGDVAGGGVVVKRRTVLGSTQIVTNYGASSATLNVGTGFSSFGSVSNNALSLITNNAEVARLTSTGNLLIGGTTDMTGSGGLKIAGTTAATTTTSGALIVAGGVGVSGAVYGDELRVKKGGGTSSYINGLTLESGAGAGNFWPGVEWRDATLGSMARQYSYREGGSFATSMVFQTSIAGSATPTTALTINSAQAATFAGAVSTTNSTASTGVGTGALQVAGGIYAGAASVFGGTVKIGGEATLSNTSSTQAALDLAGSATSNVVGYTSRTTRSSSSYGAYVRLDSSSLSGGVKYLFQSTGDLDTGGAGSFRLYNDTSGTTLLSVASTGAATFSGAIAINNTTAAAVAAPSTHKVSILIGGVQYYLLASNV
jgi:hypothetical protein